MAKSENNTWEKSVEHQMSWMRQGEEVFQFLTEATRYFLQKKKPQMYSFL